MNLNLLVLWTPKLEDLRGFYSALGARFETERHGNGPEHYAAMLSDNMVLELYPMLDGAAPDPRLRLGFSVNDIEETLRSLGVDSPSRLAATTSEGTTRPPLCRASATAISSRSAPSGVSNCNASALVPTRKSSIAVVSPRR